MSVPPEALQKLMAGGGASPAQPDAGAMPGPAAAPMQMPLSADGAKTAALPKVEIAMKMLMAALPDLGATSEEGGVVYKVLHMLQKTFGDQDGDELVPAEMQMLQQGQAPGPDQQAMMAGDQQQKMPGAPPGM